MPEVCIPAANEAFALRAAYDRTAENNDMVEYEALVGHMAYSNKELTAAMRVDRRLGGTKA